MRERHLNEKNDEFENIWSKSQKSEVNETMRFVLIFDFLVWV